MLNFVRTDDAASLSSGETLDRAGAAASFLCALHCAVMPFVITALPLLGLGFLASEPVEWALLGCSGILGALSLCVGFREHRRRPERVAELEPFHIWTTDSVRRNRIDFRPRHELTAIVVAARALAQPLTVPLLPEYAGCKSWVDLVDVNRSGLPAAPVHGDAYLRDVAEQVRFAVG